MQHRNRPYLSWAGFGFSLLLTALFLTLVGLPGPATPVALAQDEKEADIVVQFGERNVAIRTITFTDSISGLLALEQSGLDVGTVDFGDGFIAVCNIEGVGCPATPDGCFCAGNTFWNYNFWDGSAWQGYPVGAATTVISRTGVIEGWRWGEFGAAQATPIDAQAAADTLDYLRDAQEAAGGYAGVTADVMLSLGANLLDGASWTADGGPSILDYWLLDDIAEDEYPNNAARFAATSPAGAAKLLLAVQAAGADPAEFAGLDLVAAVGANYDAATGAYGPSNWDQAFSMLAVASTGSEAPPVQAVAQLAERVTADGAWDYLPDGAGDTNSTALAVQALRAAGECRQAPLIQDALVYLKSAQNEDGGFGFTPDGESDANSTAYVIQALLAAGQNPTAAVWSIDGVTPLDALRGFQLGDGSFEWLPGGGSNALATGQAVPALLRTPFVAADDLVTCGELYLPLVKSE